MAYWLNHRRLNRLDSIKNIDIHVQTVSGEDKTIDVVVEIFNNVNSGGTKLSKGDLALAKICAEWPDARETLKDILTHFQKAGYNFTMEWLLRCLTVYLTGQPYYNALGQHKIEEIKKALPITEKMIGTCLDHIGTRLGLDHDRVLGSVFAIVTMIGYIVTAEVSLQEAKNGINSFIGMCVPSFGGVMLVQRSNLAQDLNAINRGEGYRRTHRLQAIQRDLTIRAEDFWGWSTGARFYPLLYLLTRTNHSRDWGTNIELSNNLLGKNSTLDVHHIFPKDLLYKAGKTKSIVNALANYAFLTKETNIEISNLPPEEYLPVYMERCPGAVESHWIPVNRDLWKIDNYELLSERRILLAKAANDLLFSLQRKNNRSEVV